MLLVLARTLLNISGFSNTVNEVRLFPPIFLFIRLFIVLPPLKIDSHPKLVISSV